MKVILRSIYRLFCERPLWWFLSRVKAFFLAEIGPQLESTGHRLAAIEDRLRSTEANNSAQWSALEQLLLALYRQPEVRIETVEKICRTEEEQTSSAAGQERLYERNDIR
jgi:hypothetical protein